jgi:hypothetical protein
VLVLDLRHGCTAQRISAAELMVLVLVLASAVHWC